MRALNPRCPEFSPRYIDGTRGKGQRGSRIKNHTRRLNHSVHGVTAARGTERTEKRLVGLLRAIARLDSHVPDGRIPLRNGPGITSRYAAFPS